MIERGYFQRIRDQIPWPVLLKKFGLKIGRRKGKGNDKIEGVMKCSFHTEKHGSCLFYKDGGFNCLSCGTFGDIFKFVQLKLRLSAEDTILFFHREFAIPLPIADWPLSLKTIKKAGKLAPRN